MTLMDNFQFSTWSTTINASDQNFGKQKEEEGEGDGAE